MWKLLQSLRNKYSMSVPMYLAWCFISDIPLHARHMELTQKPGLDATYTLMSWPTYERDSSLTKRGSKALVSRRTLVYRGPWQDQLSRTNAHHLCPPLLVDATT